MRIHSQPAIPARAESRFFRVCYFCLAGAPVDSKQRGTGTSEAVCFPCEDQEEIGTKQEKNGLLLDTACCSWYPTEHPKNPTVRLAMRALHTCCRTADTGAIAQLVERYNGIVEVRGSIPLGSTSPPGQTGGVSVHTVSATLQNSASQFPGRSSSTPRPSSVSRKREAKSGEGAGHAALTPNQRRRLRAKKR